MKAGQHKDNIMAQYNNIDAAATLLDLKNGNPTPPNNNKKTKSEVQQDKNSILCNHIQTKHSAWCKLFDDMKYELCIMEQIVKNLLRQFDVIDNYPDIDCITKRCLHLSCNGYTVIQYIVTTVLNQLRSLIQETLGQHVVSNKTKTNHVNLFSKAVHLLNKYESHTWYVQGRNYETYSPDSEIQKFEALLCNIKQYFEKLLPSQRTAIYDIIKIDVACIKNTGLLAKHAFKHITNSIEDTSDQNINLFKSH